jgi:hypothetical protein
MRLLAQLLPQEIEEQVLMYLNSNNIHALGENNIPEYIWLRKKDKTIEDAVESNNLIGLRYLIEQCRISVHTNGDYAANK